MLTGNVIFDVIVEYVFPVILGVIILVLFLSSRSHRRADVQGMTTDEYLATFFSGHGVEAEEQRKEFVRRAKGSGFGKLYIPVVCKGGKFLAKKGFSPNKASFLNLLCICIIFYITLIAGNGHTLPPYSAQPVWGIVLFPTGIFVLFVGTMDGMDGAVATFTNTRTKSGAWLDHVLDRIGDTLLLVCLLPGGFLVISSWGNMGNFAWLVWTNVILIFLFEYMRAKHHEVGLHEIQPLFTAERWFRIVIQAAFYCVYGFNSILGWIIYSINGPSVLSNDPYPLYQLELTFLMLIFQVVLLIIMATAVIKNAKWVWTRLKQLDKDDSTEANLTEQ